MTNEKETITSDEVKPGYKSSEFIGPAVFFGFTALTAAFLLWFGKIENIQWIEINKWIGGLIMIYVPARSGVKIADSIASAKKLLSNTKS